MVSVDGRVEAVAPGPSAAAMLELFASTPKGAEAALVAELRTLGATAVRRVPAGATFRGDLTTAYRVCLWSRVASRVYLNLSRLRVRDPEELYAGVRALPWEDHLAPGATLAVSFKGAGAGINHTHFGGQRVKDAVVDRLRELRGARPSVDPHQPDVQISAVLKGGRLSLGLDLVGRPLHQRGYRVSPVAAPLKENLAAALLWLAGWPRLAEGGAALVDPMCGSGTLLIEGAMMAADMAPGLARERFAFETWRGHDPAAWAGLWQEALERGAAGVEHLPLIRGGDLDPAAVAAARANIERAGLAGRVGVEQVAVTAFEPPAREGLVITNPPYGQRLSPGEAEVLYGELERRLDGAFGGWQTAVLYPEGLPSALELARRCRQWPLYNGALACRLVSCEALAPAAELGPHGTMLANRLRKNLRHLGRWAGRNDVHCYRLYDADLPEYAVAVDLYHGDALWVHVQEYAPPDSVDPQAAARRRREARQALMEVLAVPAGQVFFKYRKRQKGRDQYERLDRREAYHEVEEGGLRFLVNFSDYLDTGLFLDHRLVRARLRELAAGARFLNLFAYTGTASVYAAAGGAVATTSVDLSSRYLDWARQNLELNGFHGGRHRLEAADCLEWVARAQRRPERYELIFLDPPTFSNSKRMARDWDVQRDHEALIRQVAALLAPGGVLVFSTNARRFRLSEALARDMVCTDITRASLPEDFRRNPRIHQCWEIRRAP